MIQEQLMELKALTEVTGAIHEAQVFQIKAWCQILFDTPVEIQITVEPAVVTLISKSAPEKNMLEGLDRSIKFILGEYFTVRVKIDDQEIFSSKGARRQRRKLHKS